MNSLKNCEKNFVCVCFYPRDSFDKFTLEMDSFFFIIFFFFFKEFVIYHLSYSVYLDILSAY